MNQHLQKAFNSVQHTRLIPSLDSRGYGVQDDGEVEDLRMLPLVCDFLMQDPTILVVKLRDLINARRILRNKGAFDKIR